jgi:GNAT superfamily N-acetyltransferase
MRGNSLVLRDGSIVVLREVRSADAALLADGFARLSAHSRQLRFLTGKSSLTPSELRYFTVIDHHDHEAIGAVSAVDGRGVGVARFIRSSNDHEAAEVAVTVVDDWQGRGLGTALVSRLADRARQEGICRFTALVAADKEAVVRLMQDSGTGVRTTPVRFRRRRIRDHLASTWSRRRTSGTAARVWSPVQAPDWVIEPLRSASALADVATPW